MTRKTEKTAAQIKYLKELGIRLRAARNNSALTKEEVGPKIGRAPRTVQNHETGVNAPSNPDLRKYADIYHVEIQWLLHGDINKPPWLDYHQPPEHMLPKKEHEFPDSAPGTMRVPDFENYRITKIIKPEEGRNQELDRLRLSLHNSLDYILENGNSQLIAAIHANLEQFSILVDQERRIRNLEEKMGILPSGNPKTAVGK